MEGIWTDGKTVVSRIITGILFQQTYFILCYLISRVIGTLSNFDEFSKVYKCKEGARMNPTKKCSVW